MCEHTDVYGFGNDVRFGNGHYYANLSSGINKHWCIASTSAPKAIEPFCYFLFYCAGPTYENPGHNYTVEHALLHYFAEQGRGGSEGKAKQKKANICAKIA